MTLNALPDVKKFLDNVLGMPESETLDFKRAGDVKNAIKTAAAMANTKGGYLVIGIEDAKKADGYARLIGIKAKPECIDELIRGLQQDISPSLGPPHTAAIEPFHAKYSWNGSDDYLVIIHIPESNTIHDLRSGGTYFRNGSQNRQLSSQEVIELGLKRGGHSAVNLPTDVHWKLLETEWWQLYYKNRKLTRSLPDQLGHLGLAEQKDETWHLIRAAVLLFCEHPGSLLKSKYVIRIFHYRGHHIEHTIDSNLMHPPVTVDGPVLKQIRDATEYVFKEINSDGGVQVSTTGFQLKQKYPRRVIQEAITNAVLHRDYRISKDIQIRIFANRIEVETPGAFPAEVTGENIGKIGSRPRNPVLINHIREFPEPPNLDAGEGVPMMQKTLAEAQLFPPIYREIQQGDEKAVLLILKNEARNSDWEMVHDYLKEHGMIDNRTVRDILNLSAKEVTKASKVLRQWCDEELIEVTDPAAGTKFRTYQLTSQPTKDDWFEQIAKLLKSSNLDTNQLFFDWGMRKK